MKQEIKSKSTWIRVRVHDTKEEKIFDTEQEARKWADLVAYTFDDRTMLFDIINVTECTTIYRCIE